MKFDIAIVGGGMVGAALAAALKNTALTIALIDSAPVAPSEDARLLGLNYASFSFFNTLTIWPMLAPHACPIEQIHVSHRGHFGTSHVSAKEQGLDTLGYLVPATYINLALNNTLNDTANITLLRSSTLKALAHTQEGATLTVETNGTTTTLDATIVIGADGTHSTVRELLGIPTETIDYHQSALVTTTELNRDHKNTAYERFQDKGAIAMLPMTDQRAATIWTAPNERIQYLLELDDETFLKELQTCFGYRLGRFIRTQKRAVYPLKNSCAKQQKQKNVLLIGNAAHTLHPIASQGLNLALHEISILAEYLAHKPTSLDHLPDYRKQQNFSAQLSHQLVRLFSTDFFGLSAARSIAMIGFDIFPAIKNRLMRQAIGSTRNACKK